MCVEYMNLTAIKTGQPSCYPSAVSFLSVLCFVLILISAPDRAQALQSDSEQPINLTADRAEMDDQQGISTYTGKVKLTQGSLLLTGDKLIVESKDGATEVITTFGRPGRFKQRPDDKPEDVVATAKRIRYLVTQDKLFLDGDALVIQGAQQFRGEHITYDMKTDKIKARAATGGESGGRVHMVLPGRSK